MSKTNKTIAGREYPGASRRRFLSYLGTAPTLTALGGAGLLSTLQAPNALATTGPLDAAQRRHRAFAIRRDAAILQRDRPEQTSTSNGDEQLYANRIATFTKGLPHNQLGEVDLNAYNAMLSALNSGQWGDFEAIPLGGTVKLANPQAAYCFGMVGPMLRQWLRPLRLHSAAPKQRPRWWKITGAP
jgi:hypothetical protein